MSANAADSALLSVGTSENAALAGLLAGGSPMEASAVAASAATETAAAPGSQNAALAGLLAGGNSMEVSAVAASAATATAAAPRCRFLHEVR